MLKWFRNSREFEFLEVLTIYNMPGKKKFTSKDYQAPLRRPGEMRDLTTQDGGKGTSSASNETEKGGLLLVL